MKYKPAKRTFEELTRKYNKNPKGWMMAAGHDDRGYFDIFVSNPNEVWQVKVDSIYKPTPVGLGMKVGGKAEARKVLSDKEPSFGFRPVSENLIESIVNNREEDMSSVLSQILKVEPMRLSEIRSPVIAGGPIGHGDKFRLSKKQAEMDLELRKNLKRLMFKEGIGLGYG